MGRTQKDLQQTLSRIDGRGYPAYRDLRGSWSLPQFTLEVRHVQGDPFAAPSRVAVILSPERAGFDSATLSNASRRTAISCLLARKFAHRARATRARRTGSGRSGEVTMLDPGQVVLPNTAVRQPDGGSWDGRQPRFSWKPCPRWSPGRWWLTPIRQYSSTVTPR